MYIHDDYALLARWLLSIGAMTLTPTGPALATSALARWFTLQLAELGDYA
jgi:hypothetical protein